MAKKKVNLSSSISASSNNLLKAGNGAALTQDLGALLSGSNNTDVTTSKETEVKVKDIIDNPFQPRIEIKEEAGEMGQYTSFSEDAANKASLAKQLGVDMLRGYVSREGGSGNRVYRAG